MNNNRRFNPSNIRKKLYDLLGRFSVNKLMKVYTYAMRIDREDDDDENE